MTDEHNNPEVEPNEGAQSEEKSPEELRAMLKEARSEAAKRRKDMQQLRAEFDELKNKTSAAEQAKLSEQGEYKALAEKRAEELEATKAELEATKKRQQEMTIQSAAKVAIAQLGIIDPEAAMKLADFSGLDGNENIDEAVKAILTSLVESKPYLVNKTAPPINPTNPAGSSPRRNPLIDVIKKQGSGVGDFGAGGIVNGE